MGEYNQIITYPRFLRFLILIAEKTFDVSLLMYFCAFLIFNNEQIDITSFDSLIRLTSTLLLFSSGLFLVLFHKGRYLPKIQYFFTYFIFVAYAFSSCLWARDTENVFSLLTSLIRILLLAFMIPARVKTIRDCNAIFNVYIIAILIKAVVLFFMMYALYGDDLISHRFGNNFGYNPNDTAVACICAICFLIYYLFDENNKINFSVELICILLLVVVIFLTQSKKGILGLFALPIMYMYFIRMPFKKYIPLFVALLVCVIAIVSSGILEESIEGGFERISNMLNEESSKDDSTIMREKLVRSAIELWKTHPIFGAGLNNFAIYFGESRDYYSHNNYTEILSGLGLIGFALYYIPIYVYTIRIRRNWKFPLAQSLKTLVIILLILDIGNVSYQSFSIQIIYVLLATCPYFYRKNRVNNAV